MLIIAIVILIIIIDIFAITIEITIVKIAITITNIARSTLLLKNIANVNYISYCGAKYDL